ncbi:MAG: OadG family transporter subunit [Gammaproteobacteria bacterium]|nr:OadG family transporter subunit [Gammaproteobacteria bacterium]
MENLFSQGLPLALFGIGVVFIFLCLLILATRAMSALAARFAPAAGTAPAETSPSHLPPAQMAAIIAAITLHRARRGAAA